MVTRTAGVDGAAIPAGAFARFADRWIYVFMAALFVATALVGFLPSTMGRFAAVQAGLRPAPPLILHVHAVLMGSWLLLFLAQATLMATGRTARHRELGLLAVVLAPAVLVTMIGVVRSSWSLHALIPPELMTPEASGRINFMSNVLLEQIRMAILFAVFVTWAFVSRRRDPETHKRMMVLATVMPLPAAIDRIGWLPGTMAEVVAFIPLYTLVWLLPVLIHDVARRGRVHRAYVIGIALNIPFVIAAYLLWGSPWWFDAAPRLMGALAG